MPNWTRLAQASIIASAAFLVSCTSTTDIETMPSKNFSYRVKSLVMHFTAVDYQESVNALVKEGNVSSHYLIARADDPSYPYSNAKVFQLVDENQRAWHAGISQWQGRLGLNDHSIGIEIVNQPFCQEDNAVDASMSPIMPQIVGAEKNRDLCVYPDFEEQQIQLLIKLSKEILARNPDIDPTAVVGHSDIAPARKSDPGPKFPWYRLYQEGIGAWYDNDSLSAHWLAFNQSPPSLALVQQALNAYGYDLAVTGRMDQHTVDVLAAFQTHFLPWQVSGEFDNQTGAAVFALLHKYFPARYDTLKAIYESEVQAAQAQQRLIADNTQQFQVRKVFNEGFNKVYPNASANTINRGVFKAYKGRGELFIETADASSADIFINGEKLNLDAFEASQRKQVSLHKRTVDGQNSVRVENIQPQGASIEISIPYPVLANALNDKDANSKASLFDKVDSFISAEVEQGFPGAALAVVYKGKVIKRSHYGYAKKYDASGKLLEQFEAMSSTHLFDLASNTKVLATGLAIMQLVNAGEIDIQRPIHYYLPEYRGEGRENILVADLLTHAAAYSDALEFYRPDNKYGDYFYSQNKLKTSRLLLTALPFDSLESSPQEDSDIHFMLLALLVERVSEMSLDEYTQQKIYAPLGLNNTLFKPLEAGINKDKTAATDIFGNTRGSNKGGKKGGNINFPNIREQVLQGEVQDENAFYSMQGVSGHAGLFSNTDDLTVLSQTLLNGGGYGHVRLFSEAIMARFVSPSEQSDSLGLGWTLAKSKATKDVFGPYASAAAFGHASANGTAIVIDPTYDLAIVLLSNKRHSTPTANEDRIEFAADAFETGKYASIISLIYEALIEFEAQKQLHNEK